MDNNKIMDYLYGEMSEAEQIQFEKEMARNEALSNEVQSLKEVRSFLQEHQEQPIPSTTMVVEKPSKVYRISKWWAIAASLLLLLLAGKIMDFRMSVGDGQLVMGFGPLEENKPIQPQEPELTLEQLEGMLTELKSEIKDELDKQGTLIARSDQKITDQQKNMDQWMKEVRSDQAQFTEAFWNEYDRDKNAFTTRLVNDFIDYNDLQRQEDLDMINKGFSDLAQMIQMNVDPAANLVYQPTQK